MEFEPQLFIPGKSLLKAATKLTKATVVALLDGQTV